MFYNLTVIVVVDPVAFQVYPDAFLAFSVHLDVSLAWSS
jgi:hypothetical protein